MDVSNRENLGGQDLLTTVVSLTGLPADLIQNELNSILAKSGRDSKNLTLDDLRAAMLTYLESLSAEIPAID